jgi:translation initiation factor IF-3
MAREQGLDLVEVSPTSRPPVCRVMDFGKYKYELSKKEKDSKKHQHANKVKEIQLSATIDPHDFKTKLSHAVDFLCEDMKVKINLRFRGREMAHTEFGFQVVNKFVTEVAPWGHPDFAVKLVGRSINLMISPLPRNKRAKHPSGEEPGAAPAPKDEAEGAKVKVRKPAATEAAASDTPSDPAFNNNPFDSLNLPADSASQ